MQKGTIGLLVSCLVAILTIASCGGGAGSPLGDAEAANSNSQLSANSQAPEVILSEEMPTLREASGPYIGDYLEIDVTPDWYDTLVILMHDSLVSGGNDIDVTTPTYKNSGATTESVIVGWHVDGWGHLTPEFGDALVLDSEPNEMAYATFGFKNIPAGEEMLTITAHGYGNFGDHQGNGLYIGVGDMDSGAYRWFGPYAPDAGEYVVSTWGMDTANSSGRGYVTFAVYNGDEFVLTDMSVEVGNRFVMPGFDWDLVQIGELLPPDGYFEMDLIDPEDFVLPDVIPEI